MVANGSSTTISWAAAQADRCIAAGGWDGPVGQDGSFTTTALTHTTDFVLECIGLGGTSTASVQVVVTNPDPAPVTILSVESATVAAGDSTMLSWSSTNADECEASGAWMGSKPTSGNTSSGTLNSSQTYTLTCSGNGGNAVAMITVNVMGTLNLSWVAPTQNVDGSMLTDLAGYRIYYGDSSRSYGTPVSVNDAVATSYAIQLPSGSYYVSMTAIDADGNESAYSNEV